MEFNLLIPILFSAVQAGTPILFATLGEIITERSGVLNLGVEGMMIVGAFAGFFCLLVTGLPWLALFCAGAASALMAALHGLVCLVFRGNQVVSGLALTILGTGLANFLGTPHIGKVPQVIDSATGIAGVSFVPFAVPLLGDIPVLGPVFFRQDALVYLSYITVPLIWFFLARMRWGLALRAAGENPQAVMAAGLSPLRLRWAGTLVGGFVVGLGGGYLSLAALHSWAPNITGGRGWIAVALVIFAFWRPGRAVLGAYLFAGIIALQMYLQATGTEIPGEILFMLPYVFTLLVLLISSARGKGRASPAALGVNLEPGD